MAQSESIKHIAQAMAQFQAKGITIGENAQGHNYKYVTLDKILTRLAVELPPLGLSVLQPLGNVDGAPAVITMLVHESGEWISHSYPIDKAGMRQVNDAQQMGAAISYACRYGVRALLNFGIAGEDDDGACLTEKPKAKATMPPRGVKKEKPRNIKGSVQLVKGLDSCIIIQELNAYYKENRADIEASPDNEFVISEFARRRAEIEEGGQP